MKEIRLRLIPTDDSWRSDLSERNRLLFEKPVLSSGTLEFAPEVSADNPTLSNLPQEPQESTSDSSDQA